MQFLKQFNNVIIINESLESLFNTFECFVSFSSHCILEGQRYNAKFASGGYHYVNDSRLVLQLKNMEDFNDLYNKISNFKIDKNILQKYLYFIYNLYTCSSTTSKIFDRLHISSDNFFNKMQEINCKESI